MDSKLHIAHINDKIFSWSAQEGFDLAGIAKIDDPASKNITRHLKDFLAKNYHGEMTWMERAERAHPSLIWPDARSAIILGANYAPAHDPLAMLKQKNKGTISVYAQNEDYHFVLGKKIKRIAQKIKEAYRAQTKTFIDTAPLMEKPLAAMAGIGWQGKHTNLVSRQLGSWFFLGVILTDLVLPASRAHQDNCGSCRNCLDICPTNAFPAPFQLDARRCISYLTIEHKGHIPHEFRRAIGNRIYGCDDCLAVCPWNKFAQASHEAGFHPRLGLTAPLLSELVQLDDVSFREFFKTSPIKRIGRARFVRNVLIAIGNSNDKALLPYARRALDDEVDITRAAAIWAFGQLADQKTFAAEKARRAPKETSPELRQEWLSIS